MLRSLSKKILISLLVIPLLISLSSLGMRLPSLAGFATEDPKPRPRAITQTSTKKCKQTLEEHSCNCVIEWITPPPPRHFVLFSETSYRPYPVSLSALPPASRAPPTPFLSV